MFLSQSASKMQVARTSLVEVIIPMFLLCVAVKMHRTAGTEDRAKKALSVFTVVKVTILVTSISGFGGSVSMVEVSTIQD